MSLDLLMALLGALAKLPVIGPVLALILGIALPLSVIVSALFGVWLAVVKVLAALSFLPGCAGLKDLSDKLSADEQAAESVFNKYVLPILQQLSLVPAPQVKAAPEAVK